jgi:4'-phosphopantetheinyl transferase
VDESWLTASEREKAGAMRFAKRRTDYLLGRFTAKRATALALGLPEGHATLARIEVGNDEDGAPEVRFDGRPAPISISLTDRAGWGVCAWRPSGAPVGCDLELVEPRTPTFVSDYLTPSEQRAVAAGGDEDARNLLANLVWSAKESILKILHTGLRRDTRDVEITLAPPGGAGWQPFRANVADDDRAYEGWWRRHGAFVLTVAADARIHEPLSTHDPSPLEGAIPSHHWLESPLVPSAPAPARTGGMPTLET